MASELAEALLKVQAELKPLPRKRKGQAGNRSTKYADLADFEEAVFPLLNSVGLVWMTKPLTRDDGRFVLYYAMIHAATGEREDGEYPLHEGTGQQKGSEITYARRHCLGAITGAVAEGDDDDASRASQPSGSQGRSRQPQRPSAPVTRAPTTGADHERLRHGTVEATPDDRPAQRARKPDEHDAWAGQPAGKLPGVAGSVGMIQQHFKRLEVLDREERLGLTAQLAGWKQGDVIGSTNDLSADEVKRVLDQLGRCRNHEALMKLVTHGERPGESDD